MLLTITALDVLLILNLGLLDVSKTLTCHPHLPIAEVNDADHSQSTVVFSLIIIQQCDRALSAWILLEHSLQKAPITLPESYWADFMSMN